MSVSGCPGAERFKHPQPEERECPFCGAEVEIWTDELSALCPKCKKDVPRDLSQCCIGWCKYARECVGDELYNKYMERKRKGGE